jgi:hypothetical protein
VAVNVEASVAVIAATAVTAANVVIAATVAEAEIAEAVVEAEIAEAVAVAADGVRPASRETQIARFSFGNIAVLCIFAPRFKVDKVRFLYKILIDRLLNCNYHASAQTSEISQAT